jgi:hypothetical protein
MILQRGRRRGGTIGRTPEILLLQRSFHLPHSKKAALCDSATIGLPLNRHFLLCFYTPRNETFLRRKSVGMTRRC